MKQGAGGLPEAVRGVHLHPGQRDSAQGLMLLLPDVISMTTAILWVVMLYTDQATDLGEIGRRVLGQLLGYALVSAVAAANRKALEQSVDLIMYVATDGIHAFNEGLARAGTC